MQKLPIALGLPLIIVISIQISSVACLSRYCHISSQSEFRNEFNNCVLRKQDSAEYSTVYQADRTPIETQQKYEEVLKLLDKITVLLQGVNITKYETKYLFLDMVHMIKILYDDNTMKLCMRGVICNLFKHCELPMDIEYKDWENDAMVAARIASLLTSWSASDAILNTNYLTQMQLYSVLHSAVADYDTIYESKIVFMANATSSRLAFSATKDVSDRSIKYFY